MQQLPYPFLFVLVEEKLSQSTLGSSLTNVRHRKMSSYWRLLHISSSAYKETIGECNRCICLICILRCTSLQCLNSQEQLGLCGADTPSSRFRSFPYSARYCFGSIPVCCCTNDNQAHLNALKIIPLSSRRASTSPAKIVTVLQVKHQQATRTRAICWLHESYSSL